MPLLALDELSNVKHAYNATVLCTRGRTYLSYTYISNVRKISIIHCFVFFRRYLEIGQKCFKPANVKNWMTKPGSNSWYKLQHCICFIQGYDINEAGAQVSVGVLTVIDEDGPFSPNLLHLDPVSNIIVEAGVVMDELENLPQALCILFGLSYCMCYVYTTLKQRKNACQWKLIHILQLSVCWFSSKFAW